MKNNIIEPEKAQDYIAMSVASISIICIGIFWWPRTERYTSLEKACAGAGSLMATAVLTALAYFTAKHLCKKNESQLTLTEQIYEDDNDEDESDVSDSKHLLGRQP